jgi:metallophosphoesterase (TIGR00282 family)
LELSLIIAFIADVFGRPGRRTVEHIVPKLKDEHAPDLIIANLENAAGGFGITPKAFGELERAGVQFFTSGNHIWDKREGIELLNSRNNIVRPANYPGNSDGVGFRVISVGDVSVAIVNLQGRTFMPPLDCPFRAADQILKNLGDKCRVRIIDMHAEATSEKKAMAYYVDGRASAVLGTHTHVPTKDAQILPNGTAFVTDVGMTGANHSILGVAPEPAIQRFLDMRPKRFDVANTDLRSDLVVIDIDEESGKARSIQHLQYKLEEE